jgi:hypothetical protein
MMGDSSTLIIGILVFVVVGGIVAYYVIRGLKGNLTLALNQRGIGSGDKFTGTVKVVCKKPVEGNRLVATLIGTEKIVRRTDDETETEICEFYRDDAVLEGARSYEAGFEESYNFELVAPSAANAGTASSSLGKMMEVGMEMLTGRDRDVYWKIEGRLDAKGLDLVDSEKVTINLS